MKVTQVIPLWLATWELDCCHDDFAVGDWWETTLVTYDDVEPSADQGDTLEPVDELGAVRLAGTVERAAPNEHHLALLRVGSLAMGVRGITRCGRVSGTVKLHFEGHGPWMGVEPEEVRVAGRVRRIERVPIVYREVRPRMFEVAGHMDPVDVATTSERREHDELLITLEPTEQARLRLPRIGPDPDPLETADGRDSDEVIDDAACFHSVRV